MTRCIAIDDEPIALSIIEEYTARWNESNPSRTLALETFSSPREAVARMEQTTPQIVFLDIEMGGVSGLEIAHSLPEGCVVVFTTAYANYALEGFEADAADFLHKPFFYDRFARAVEKALALIPKTGETSESITLKAGYKNVVVRIADIVLVEAMENYVRVHMREGSVIVSQVSLKAVEAMLKGRGFIRVHRSAIVACGAVRAFTRTSLTIEGVNRKVPVGRKYGAATAEALARIGGQEG